MSKTSKMKAIRREWHTPDPLSLSPQDINDDLWYYEERGGIDLHVWVEMPKAMSRGERHHVNVRIPWRKLVASVKRKRLTVNPSAREP